MAKKCSHGCIPGHSSKCTKACFDGNEAKYATEGTFKNGKAPRTKEYAKAKKVGPFLIEYGKKK